jgi:hypothetical protein
MAARSQLVAELSARGHVTTAELARPSRPACEGNLGSTRGRDGDLHAVLALEIDGGEPVSFTDLPRLPRQSAGGGEGIYFFTHCN